MLKRCGPFVEPRCGTEGVEPAVSVSKIYPVSLEVKFKSYFSNKLCPILMRAKFQNKLIVNF